MTPTRTARKAEIRDPQKPGYVLVKNIGTKPTIPLIRNTQPINNVVVELLIEGTTIARHPNRIRTAPSIRKRKRKLYSLCAVSESEPTDITISPPVMWLLSALC